MNSRDVGDATKTAIISRLLSVGYVSVPFGDNDGYNLIVDDGTDLRCVQCKTTWLNKERTIRFTTHSQTTDGVEYRERSYRDEIDAFLVRHPNFDRLYWVDVEDATDGKMELRHDATIDHPSIN